MNSISDFSAPLLNGEAKALSDFAGQVVLIVNVASRCGFTPQYSGLERLYGSYAARGFTILGFPCNQFGAQEPGDATEIARFCSTTYDVTFPIFAKIEVNGTGTHPLYQFLKQQQPGLLGTQAIKWNFTKFLIDREGHPVARFSPQKKPQALASAIEKLLIA
jgi:glutathione peroxidase